jgi:hypothetical protein
MFLYYDAPTSSPQPFAGRQQRLSGGKISLILDASHVAVTRSLKILRPVVGLPSSIRQQILLLRATA